MERALFLIGNLKLAHNDQERFFGGGGGGGEGELGLAGEGGAQEKTCCYSCSLSKDVHSSVNGLNTFLRVTGNQPSIVKSGTMQCSL